MLCHNCDQKPIATLRQTFGTPIVLALAWLLLGALAWPRPAQAITYTNITSVTTQQLSNGVQVLVKADGVLDWQYEHRGRGERETTKAVIRFPGARYSGKSFINVDSFPISYIQLEVPQDAKEGVGVLMTVALSTPTGVSVTQSTDQQSVIVTANSDRTLETSAGKAGTTATTAPESLKVHFRNGLVSVHAVKADVQDVLAEIARQSNTDIAVDDHTHHKVSLWLDNMPAGDVFRAIASGYGLALSKVGNLYMFSEGVPSDLATYHLSGTRSFPMKYLRAQTASGLLPTFLFSYLHVNSEQNAVVVTAPTQMLDKIGKDLAKVDIAAPQIMIEALAVEFSSTQDFNAALSVSANNFHNTASLDTGTGSITFDTIGMLPRSFQANIQALAQEGRARIRSNPRMAVLNGQTANIFVGAQRFILVKFEQYGSQSEKIEGVDVGVKLAVSPWTGGNGEITTKISPEVSNISEVDPQSGLPVLSTRRAETTVRVKDGETVVIGGLALRQVFETRRKIPILGDLPLIGWLFQSRDKTADQSELAIFITPHIIKDGTGAPAAAGGQPASPGEQQSNGAPVPPAASSH